MIQRAQTLFLLGAIILQIALFFTPFWKGNATVDFNGQQKSASASLSIMKLSQQYKGQIDAAGNPQELFIFEGFNGAIVLLSFYCILLFRNRKTQLRISRFLLFLTGGLMVLLIYSSEQAKSLFADDASNLQRIGTNFKMVTNTYDIGLFLPIASLILFFLAGRYIQKDEKLVRSADRLR